MASVNDKGTLVAYVSTASPLSEKNRAALVEKLSKEAGQTVSLDERIAPTALGGIRIQFGDYLYDGTVAKQLKDIRTALLSSGDEEV